MSKTNIIHAKLHEGDVVFFTFPARITKESKQALEDKLAELIKTSLGLSVTPIILLEGALPTAILSKDVTS